MKSSMRAVHLDCALLASPYSPVGIFCASIGFSMEVRNFLSYPSIVSSRFKELRLRASLREICRKYRAYTMVQEAKFVRNLELVHGFKHIRGCVVECGVWRGGMSAAMAEVLGTDRQYFLFDSFEGLPPAREDLDGPAAVAWQHNTTSPAYYNNCTAAEGEAAAAMKLSGATSFSLVKGWFSDTVPAFKPPSEIAVLRLDGDWYDSTRVCLENLVPFVADHGVVVIDDYYEWDGCARAVNEYMLRAGSPSEVVRLRQFRNLIAYFIKGDVRLPRPQQHLGSDSSPQRDGSER
jgi:O-methyltransferase